MKTANINSTTFLNHLSIKKRSNIKKAIKQHQELSKEKIALIEKEIIQPIRDDMIVGYDTLNGHTSIEQFLKSSENIGKRMTTIFKNEEK